MPTVVAHKQALRALIDQVFAALDESPRVNQVPSAMAIQACMDRSQWVTQPGNPVSCAPCIRRQPPHGHPAKSVIFQFAKGDQTVPNPTTSAIPRAGALAGRATHYRADLAWAADIAVPKNPLTFLTNISNPAAAPDAIGAQQQMAVFLASHGTAVIDPDGAGPYFVAPIAGPLPETLNALP